MRRLLVLAVLVWLTGMKAALAQDLDRGWLDVNFGAASPAEDAFVSTRVQRMFQETATSIAGYSVPRGGMFDVGGGYMFTRRVGLGVSLSGSVHEDAALLTISIPHPLVFNALAGDVDVTDGVLRRSEGGLHIQAMLVVAETPKVRFRVFGGPSHFGIEQDTIDQIRYDQVYQLFGRGNSVDITSYTTNKSEGSAWGAHGGFDVSVFFSKVIGVGGELRVARGTVTIDDFGGPSEVKAGGVHYGGGLRLRF